MIETQISNWNRRVKIIVTCCRLSEFFATEESFYYFSVVEEMSQSWHFLRGALGVGMLKTTRLEVCLPPSGYNSCSVAHRKGKGQEISE